MSRFLDVLENFGETFQAVLRQIARVMNWRLVRNLAELQLLTRASYVTLIVVPLLAGLWPTVRLVVNQHNKAVAEAAAIFDKATIRFEQAEHQIGLRVPVSQPVGSVQVADASGPSLGEKARKEASAVLDELKQSVSQYRSDYANKSIESPGMPRTFAAAFFAALATVLAHTIYQMSAPEPVRKMTLDQFIAVKKEDYSRHPTPTALEAAQTVIEGEGAKHTHDDYFRQRRLMDKILSAPDARSAARTLSLSEQIELQAMRDQREFTGDNQKRIVQVLEIAEAERSGEQFEEFRRQQDMAVVAQAAERSYLNSAGNAPLMIILTALIYGVALYLICSILVNQTASVMSSAGIHSLSGILEWWKPNS